MSGEPVTPAARHCGVCGIACGPRLIVVPACELHSHPDEVAAALNEQRDHMMLVTAALARWLQAKDDRAPGLYYDRDLWDRFFEAETALERMARKVVG